MNRCRSLHKVILHRENGLEVYLRCKKGEGHTGRNHDHRLKKWTDDEEDGWFEDDYDDAPDRELEDARYGL